MEANTPTPQSAKLTIEKACKGNLPEIVLYNENLFVVPPELSRARAVVRLLLGSNFLTTLPSFFSSFNQLTLLGLGFNKFETIPPVIFTLTGLKALQLYGNRITHVPPEIGSLRSLQELQLYQNRIRSLSPSISNLHALHTLELHNNELASLPFQLGRLRGLTTLRLEENPLPEPLTTLLSSGNVEAILSHIRATSDGSGLGFDDMDAEGMYKQLQGQADTKGLQAALLHALDCLEKESSLSSRYKQEAEKEQARRIAAERKAGDLERLLEESEHRRRSLQRELAALQQQINDDANFERARQQPQPEHSPQHQQPLLSPSPPANGRRARPQPAPADLGFEGGLESAFPNRKEETGHWRSRPSAHVSPTKTFDRHIVIL